MEDIEQEAYQKALELGLSPRRSGNGWAIHCPNKGHVDRTRSAKLFPDGWVACFAGDPRINILGRHIPRRVEYYRPVEVSQERTDYFDYWLALEPLEEGIKGLPARHLNSLGWRKLPNGNPLGVSGGIFIPYFSKGRDSIYFFQVRHLEGDRRFSFPPGQNPIANGFESLPRAKRYLAFTEGASDRAVLEFAGVPTLAIPSASSFAILEGMAKYAKEGGLVLVACTDVDTAGDNLLHHLASHAAYIDMRPPKPYKDYGEMFEAVGIEPIKERLRMLLPKKEVEVLDEYKFKERFNTAWEILFNSKKDTSGE